MKYVSRLDLDGIGLPQDLYNKNDGPVLTAGLSTYEMKVDLGSSLERLDRHLIQ